MLNFFHRDPVDALQNIDAPPGMTSQALSEIGFELVM